MLFRRPAEAVQPIDERIAELLKSRPRSSWRTLALNQARGLYEQFRAAVDGSGVQDVEGNVDCRLIRENIERGASAAQSADRRFRSWFSGADIETAWAALQAADERLILIEAVPVLRARLGRIDTALRSDLKADDPRLKEYTDRLGELRSVSDEALDAAREQTRGFLHDCHVASTAAHGNVRATRNTLLEISVGTIALLIVVCVVHALAPGFIDLSSPHGDAVEAWWAVLIGSLGGVIGALATVWRLSGSVADSRLPNAQAFVRIPLGGAVGLAGVMLVQSGFISPLKSQTPLALLVIAFLAGYTPDVLLRFLDRRLQQVLSQARGKDDPARPALTTPRPSLPTVPAQAPGDGT
jgi:hypothetical protein